MPGKLKCLAALCGLVAALVTMLEVASRQPQDPAGYRRMIEQLLGDAQLLRKLVERLMEHARSERAANDPPEETDVSALLDSCADTAERFGSARRSRVIRAFRGDLRCVLHGERLRSIVTNLLSNAVDYVHAGGTIELAAHHDGERLRLSIRDDGPGIAPQHLPKLFDPFYRVDKFSGEEHLGLGLFIVRRHVRTMQGDVRVESQPGRGTTFFVDLPCAALAEKETAAHTGSAVTAWSLKH